MLASLHGVPHNSQYRSCSVVHATAAYISGGQSEEQATQSRFHSAMKGGADESSLGLVVAVGFSVVVGGVVCNVVCDVVWVVVIVVVSVVVGVVVGVVANVE